LIDDPPRVRSVATTTSALLIDHERAGYGEEVVLPAGTLLLWIGSAYQHAMGFVLHGAHVLAVLSGDLRGECVEVRVDGPGHEDLLPGTMPSAGESQPLYRVLRQITKGVWTTDRRNSLDPGTRLRRIEVVQYLEDTGAGPFMSSVGRYEVLDGGTPGALAEITHATIHDDEGPAIEEHPDLEAVAYTGPSR
jgi:hypothetical protein